MWYKKTDDQWFTGNKIEFPDGFVLSDNHLNSREGWFWSDNEPEEYFNWKQDQLKRHLFIDQLSLIS
jgi:hypothetical protein